MFGKRISKNYRLAIEINLREKNSLTQKYNSAMLYFLDIIFSRIQFGLSAEEYSVVQAYKMSKVEKSKVISRRERDEIVKKYNDLTSISEIEDKVEFLQNFKGFLGREYFLVRNSTFSQFSDFVLKHNSFIAKHSRGRQGQGIRMYHLPALNNSNIEEVYRDIISCNYDVIEEQLKQHPDFEKINTSGFPCIRVVTFLNDESETEFIFSFLTVSGRGDEVINVHRDGIMMNIDTQSGRVTSMGIDKDGNTFEYHPLTNQVFKDFEISMWEELLKLVGNATTVLPNIRFVGWDIGVFENGPAIIEANAIRPGITNIQSPYLGNNSRMYDNLLKVREGLQR